MPSCKNIHTQDADTNYQQAHIDGNARASNKNTAYTWKQGGRRGQTINKFKGLNIIIHIQNSYPVRSFPRYCHREDNSFFELFLKK